MLLRDPVPTDPKQLQALANSVPRHSIPDDPFEQEALIAQCLTKLRVLHHRDIGNLPRKTPFTTRLHALTAKRIVTVGEAQALAKAQKTVVYWLTFGQPRPLVLRQTARFCALESKVNLEQGQFFYSVVEEACAILYNWKDGSSPMGMLSVLLPKRVSGLWAKLSKDAADSAKMLELLKSEAACSG